MTVRLLRRAGACAALLAITVACGGGPAGTTKEPEPKAEAKIEPKQAPGESAKAPLEEKKETVSKKALDDEVKKVLGDALKAFKEQFAPSKPAAADTAPEKKEPAAAKA